MEPLLRLLTIDAADENGNLIEEYKDLFGKGRVMMLTYNTSSNNPNEMIVDDLLNFWEFKVKVSTDQKGLTFQTNTTENNNLVSGYEDINVQISGGKILPQAGHQNNGSPADSIVFYVSFSDDDYPEQLGYKNYRVSGIRYSGLKEND